MSSGVRFRCYPKGKQGSTYSQWIGCQRFIFNSKVEEDQYFRTFRNHSLDLTGQYTPTDQQYSQFKDKELTPFLYDVPSQILRNGAYRYMQAHMRFTQGLAGRPAKKKAHGRQTVMLTNELFKFVPTGRVVQATKEGYVIHEHKLFIGTDKFPVESLSSRRTGHTISLRRLPYLGTMGNGTCRLTTRMCLLPGYSNCSRPRRN